MTDAPNPGRPVIAEATATPVHAAAEIRVGAWRLKGAAALATTLVLLVLIVGAVVWSKPWRHPSPLWICGLLWLVFLIYWSAKAADRAAATSAESPASRALHSNLLNIGLLLLFIPVPGLRLRWLPLANWVAPTGITIQALSLALMIWARRHLGRNWSGEIAKKVGHELVRSGPYRVLRHPIYTGMLGMYLGTAMVAGQLHALLGFAIAAIAYARKIRLEERSMRELFGTEYDEYRKQSWALVPPVF